MAAQCWFCIRPAWWFLTASHVDPICQHPCPSSCPPPGPDQRSSRWVACPGHGGHCRALPVCGTPSPYGSGWAAAWEAASSGGRVGEGGRTYWAGRCTVQSGRRDGGRPLPGTTAGCSCRSHCWSPGASSSAGDEWTLGYLDDHRWCKEKKKHLQLASKYLDRRLNLE